MSALNYWMQEIADRLSEATGIKVQTSEVVRPPDTSMGEFAYACFRLAKERAKSPVEIAREIADLLKKDHPDFTEIQAVGPYVNFRLATGEAVARVVRDIEAQKERYGIVSPEKGQELLFEYANPNTHKEVHIGHLRNFVLGVSLARILKAGGRNITPISYVNDVGSNVAKCLWLLVKKANIDIRTVTLEQAREALETVPQEERNGKYLGNVYTEVTRVIEEDASLVEDVSFVQAQLEKHDPAWDLLWRETRRWCLDELASIFVELGIKMERQYFESEVIDEAGPLVTSLLEKGIARESEGAVIIDLEEQKLGIMMIRKSDGNLLYASKDLPLAFLKIKEYPATAQSYVLADFRQTLYFKQLQAVLKKLEVKADFDLIAYGLVTLPEGAMSSRKGNIVTYQGLRDAVVEYAKQEIVSRHPDWNEGKVDHTAWTLAMSGIKFALLRQDSDKNLVFDMQEALSFDGATGPYCQYAAIRFASIFRKAGVSEKELSGSLVPEFAHASEKALALSLAQLPSLIILATRDLRPSVIAQWCHETAQRMNEFYRDVPVLESVGPQRIARLRLIAASRQVLAQGLELLGISLPDEM